jgi:hypothetical protein
MANGGGLPTAMDVETGGWRMADGGDGRRCGSKLMLDYSLVGPLMIRR